MPGHVAPSNGKLEDFMRHGVSGVEKRGSLVRTIYYNRHTKLTDQADLQ